MICSSANKSLCNISGNHAIGENQMKNNNQPNLNEIELCLKSKLKNHQWELFFESADILKVNMQKEKIDFASSGLSSGLGIRVIINNKPGFSSTNNIKNYKECIENAVKIANLNNIDKSFKTFVSKSKYKNIKSFDKKLLEQSNEQLKSYFQDYIQNIKSINSSITLASGQYEKSISTTRIINSEGIDAELTSAANGFARGLLLGENTAYETSEDSKSPLNAKKAFEDVSRLLAMVEKQQTKTQDMQLLLHPEAAADLLSSFIGYNFSGENVGLKKSKFFNSLNKQETSKILTIVDDATASSLLATRAFDDEGFTSQKNILLNKGVVKSFLYDNYNALKFKKKNTGSSSRSYISLPEISSTNLLVSPGNKTEQKFISSLDNAIYVKSLLGTHTIDNVSGSMSLGVIEGYIIKNGQIKKAVKDTMIAGNLFEMFKNIESLGKNIIHGGGAIYTPHILIKNIKVIGN